MKWALPPIPLMYKNPAQERIHILIELFADFSQCREFSFTPFQVGEVYLLLFNFECKNAFLLNQIFLFFLKKSGKNYKTP